MWNRFRPEDRRVALYGPRGVGKSALLHGIAHTGIERHGTQKLPIVAKISEARSVTSVADLEERFFTAIARGIARVPEVRSRWSGRTKKENLVKYSPWLAQTISATAGLFVQPISLASEVVAETVRSVTHASNFRALDEMLASSSTKASRLSDLLTTKINERGIEPVFIIDELDKVMDRDVLHNFAEGNQSWFEGKNVVFTLSYNIGESLKHISTASVSRIASVEPYTGLTSTSECKEIIYKRASVGFSAYYPQLSGNEKDAMAEVRNILPERLAEEIIERTFPNPFRMLRLTYEVLDEASTRGKEVGEALDSVLERSPDVSSIPRVRVTKQRLKVLKALSTGPMTLTDLALFMGVERRQLFTALTLMVRNGLLRTTKEGRRAYYHLTEEGNTVLRLNT